MERIKQALEKARLERQKSGGAATAQSGGNPASGPVTYTQTRTVHIATEMLRERRIICGIEQNAFTDAYKMLRTQVLQRLRENKWNALAITSPGVNEGKTVTAINLAISLALEVNYTVLLVDADLRKPGVHSYFGIEAEYGLSDYLTSDKSLSELLVHPVEIPGFVILPGGKPLGNSAEMLSSPKMARLVEELKSRYSSRIILFDVPPLLNAADALAFSPYVDAALLVLEDAKTEAQDAKRAVELLQQSTHVLGTVLNKSWSPLPTAKDNSTPPLFAGWQSRAALIGAVVANQFSKLRKQKS